MFCVRFVPAAGGGERAVFSPDVSGAIRFFYIPVGGLYAFFCASFYTLMPEMDRARSDKAMNNSLESIEVWNF